MSFPVHTPAAPLRPFVAVAHGYRVPASQSGLHRGLPSQYLTLVIELNAPLRIAGLGEPIAANGIVGGLHTQPALIDASVPQDGIQYSLTPAGMHALFGVPAAALRGYAVDLADVFGARARELVERLYFAGSWRERFALVDAALLGAMHAADNPARPELLEAWRVIFANNGGVRIGALAEHVGWSRRHLSERFRAFSGLTPKEAARIARFTAARQLLLASRRLPLVDIATRCGYADQPHLAREWRALAGCSVSTWLREELPFVQASEAPDEAESSL